MLSCILKIVGNKRKIKGRYSRMLYTKAVTPWWWRGRAKIHELIKYYDLD